MRPRLGDARAVWATRTFAVDMKRRFYDDFVSALCPRDGILRCSGPLDGGACAHGFEVDVAAAPEQFAGLHLDHE